MNLDVKLAKVTATGPPVTVTLQGSSTALSVARKWTTAALSVADEVRVAIVDGQVELLAKVT